VILVTGGAGFIGANFVLNWIAEERQPIVNLDKLTYAGNLNNLASLEHDARHHFVQGDILDRSLIQSLLQKYRPQAIVHFAAETHVDRSIYQPHDFVQTNVVGTCTLLEESLAYWKGLNEIDQNAFRFIHVSTDEVYGSLAPSDPPSLEDSVFMPNSPYSASKASADHFVRSFFHTYGMPTINTHCTNNFGPYQFPEKLIPLMIVNALQGKPLPIYGDGMNIRNWLYVEDHCEALKLVLKKGKPGEVYNIGALGEMTNKAVVETLCALLDELRPSSPFKPHSSLIKYVKDRPGHDRRYALDSTKIMSELGWKTKGDFSTHLRKTVAWYLDNLAWVENVVSGEYRAWVNTHYCDKELV
jgi:dTDP-glucose 4,6-dehydratase